MPKIFFDCSNLDEWARIAFSDRIDAGGGATGNWSIAASQEEADYRVSIASSSLLEPSAFLGKSRRDFSYVWDTSDFPTGISSGLYCSLPKGLFDRRRHRSFCYNIFWNELIRKYPLDVATRLFSFVGGITSGVRNRMAQFCQHGVNEEYEFRLQSGPWDSMFDRSGLEVKRAYAESVRDAKFVLCPRGNGVASIRLFETMEAQRVPVIISDRYVLPEGIDWERCSLRIRERDVRRLPEILKDAEPGWKLMAESARLEWEMNFSPTRILESIGTRLLELDQRSSALAKPKALVEYLRMRSRIVLPKILRSAVSVRNRR